ncbi:MAG: hypothetical protein RLZZ157_1067 [Pseudomonadota bacterium]|jgi:phosphate transport system permease protein
MTEPVTATPADAEKTARHARLAAKTRQRHAGEVRFRAFTLAMVGTAILACVLLLASIISQSVQALTLHRLHLTVDVSADKADPVGQRRPLDIREQGNFSGMVQDGLLARFPNAEADGKLNDLFDITTALAAVPIGRTIAADPGLIGGKLAVSLPINDDLDLFFKGAFGKTREIAGSGPLVVATGDGVRFRLSGNANAFAPLVADLRQNLMAKAEALDARVVVAEKGLVAAQADVKLAGERLNAAKAIGKGVVAAEAVLTQAQTTLASQQTAISLDRTQSRAFRAAASPNAPQLNLDDDAPSVLIETKTATFKLLALTPSVAIAKALVRPSTVADTSGWRAVLLASPENGRAISDATIAFGRKLAGQGAITQSPNTIIFTHSDSNEPELSGLLSAFVGSVLTLAVTICLAVPIGVATAIYLEEFAPKNALTDFIEVNINNLAAVPSIVFGLLGFAVFLTFFNMPRSAPIVGGIVLALMSLPVIIIAARASLKSVPPSIREAALGVGASKMQAIFNHVLPLALPGIMTGSILALAHALGETAPLLMIGMVAFIADVPTGLTDSATVLPVELFMWASRPERAWEPRTALAIILLLLFMIVMNGVALFVRRKFETKW